jgi:catechol-2,3-dioxygenase
LPIASLNHAVLYVRDADRSSTFYEEVLGFRRIGAFPGAVFMQAAGSSNDHDLGLFSIGDGAAGSTAGSQSVGLYHLAWEVDTLAELESLAKALAEHGALVGATDHGTTKGVYGRDPDGIEFELTWLVPADRLPDAAAWTSRALDFEKEKERYGADTRGGVGVSHPAPVA